MLNQVQHDVRERSVTGKTAKVTRPSCRDMRRKVNNVIQGLQVSAAGMKAQMDCQDVIANNLANVSTPGFKRSSASFASFSTQFQEAVRNPMTPMPPHAPYALPTLVVQQDAEAGMVQDTGSRRTWRSMGPARSSCRLRPASGSPDAATSGSTRPAN